MLLAAILTAASPVPRQVEPPRTVNGRVLGAAEDFATRGPGRACLHDMAVDAAAGETVYLSYAGIHSGSLRLVMGGRFVEFRHGEMWATPKRGSRPVGERPGYRLYRGSGRRYGAFRRVEGGDGYRPVVWTEGDAGEAR